MGHMVARILPVVTGIWNRYQRNDPRTNAGMCVAFMVISAAGANVFFAAGDWPVGLLFFGLFAYATAVDFAIGYHWRV